MKKFLSYLLVFITVFAISTTITIKVKSELLDSSSPTTTAGASGEVSLLGGMMNSFEEEPKLNINGTIGLSIGEEYFDIDLNANVDLTVLTSPEIDANITIKYNDNQTDIRVVFKNNIIYISHANIQIKASIDGINSAVEAVKNLFESISLDLNVSANSSFVDEIKDKLSGVSVDSLMDALSNPKKTILENLDQYEVEFPNICKLFILCDEKFNISNIRIEEFVLGDSINLSAELFVSQDSKIKIAEPDTATYFDIASAIRGVGDLFEEDYIRVDAWVSLYKNKLLKQNVSGYLNIDSKNSKYNAGLNLKGAIEGQLDAHYIGETLYAKFNDINISANKSTIEQLVALVKLKLEGLELSLPDFEIDDVVSYIKQNYKQILDGATILNNQIKLQLDLSTFVPSLSELAIIIEFDNEYRISKIFVGGLSYGDYSLMVTSYFDYPEKIDIGIDSEKYLPVEKIMSLVDTFKNLEKFKLSGTLDIETEIFDQTFSFDTIANVKTKEFSLSLLNLFGQNINVAYLDSAVYLKVGNINLSVTKNYLYSIFGDKVQELLSTLQLPQSEQIFETVSELLTKYWIGDVLKLSQIVVEDGHVKISTELTALIGNVCKAEIEFNFTETSIDITKLEIEFEDNKISANLKFETTEDNPVVDSRENYLDVQELIEYVQSFLSSEDLVANGTFALSKDGNDIFGFDGQIGLQLAEQNFVVDGTVDSIISGDVKVVYKDGKLYLDFGAQHYNISKEAAIDAAAQLGYDIAPIVQNVENILSQVSSLNIYGLAKEKVDEIQIDLSSIDLSPENFDLSGIEEILSLISSIKVDATGVQAELEIAGASIIAHISLSDALGINAEVDFNGYHIEADIELSKENANYEISDQSICLDPIADIILDVASLVDNTEFEGSVELNFGDEVYENINIDYKLSLNLDEKLINAELVAQVCDREIKVYVVNNKLYVEFSGMKVSATLDEILEILKDQLFDGIVPENLRNFDLANINTDNLLEKALGLVQTTTLINYLEEVGDKLSIRLLDTVDILLATNQEELSAEVSYNNISATIFVSATDHLEFEHVDPSEYIEITNLFDIAKNAYNYVAGGAYYANVNLKVAGFTITGYVGYDEDGIVFDLSTTVLGKNLNAKLKDRVVYINFDGFNAKLSLSDAAELLQKAVTAFNINIDSDILDTIIRILTEPELDVSSLLDELPLPELSIEDIINGIEIELASDKINVQFVGINADIILSNNSLYGVNACYLSEDTLNVEFVLTDKREIELADAYVDLADAQNILDTVAVLARETKYTLSFATEISGIDISGMGGLSLEENRLKLQATIGTLGKEILVVVEYEEEIQEYVLYISLDGIKIQATLDDVPAVIDWINQEFDKDIQIDIEFIKEFLDTLDLELLLDKFDLSNLQVEFDENVVAIAYNNIAATLTFDEKLTVVAEIKDITFNAEVAQAEPTFSEVDAQEYLVFADVFEIVKNVYDYITEKQFYFDIDLALDLVKDNNTTTIDIQGYAGYDDDGLVLELSTTLFGKTLSVKLVDRVLYLQFDEFKAKLSLVDAYALLEKAVEEFDIEISDELLDLLETILTSDELDIDEVMEKVKVLSNQPTDLEDIIADLELSLSLEKLVASIFDADIEVNFENSNIVSALVNYSSDKFAIDAQIALSQKRNVETTGNYADLADVKNLLGSVADILDSKQLVGTIGIKYDKIDITGDFQLSFVDGLALSLSFSLYGFDIDIKLIDKTLYLSIKDIKVKASVDDIDDIIAWVNTTFDKEIEFDSSSLSGENVDLVALLDKIDLSKLVLSIENNKLTIGYGDLSAEFALDETILGTLVYQKSAGEGEEQRKPLTITLTAQTGSTDISANTNEYESYTLLTDLVSSVMQIVNEKRVSVTLPSINIYDGSTVHYSASGSLQLDLSDEENKLFHAQVVVRDNQKGKDYDVRLSYRNGYWWIYFNNLKLKMAKADVNELLVIILKVMDIDTTLIPGLAEISASLDDINFDSLSAILPSFADFDPLNLLSYVTNLSLENGMLICDIDSSLVTDNPDAQDMRVIVDTSGGRLSHIYGQNIYTGVTNAEHFNIDIVINQNFGGVGSPASGNYIDISGSNELIKALFNTAELNYFNVSGNISASLGSWDLVDIPLILQVKLDENRKPIVYAKLDLSVLTDSLISSAANTFVFDSDYRKNHIIQIYYKDSYVYFYCTGETKPLFGSGTKHAKMLKAHIDSVLEDPMYYLKFALSFSDSIESEITKSLTNNANHEPDLGKIIESYTVKNNRNFEIVLDMKEISGDDVLGDTTINIGVINNSSTGYKNYLGTAGFDFIIDFGLKIHLSSNDIKLKNIGQSINFTAIENFINNYAYGEGREMTSSNGGSSYSVSGGKKYSVTFNSNGGAAVATRTDYPGTTFTLPTLADKIINGSGTRDVYRFVGWYEDSTLLKTPYTSGIIGHTNITVYAKWELVEEYRTISFYLDGTKVADSLMLVGSNIVYGNLQQDRIVESGGYKNYQTFERYADANGNTVSVVGSQNQNVYIVYATTLSLRAYTLSFNSGLAPAEPNKSVYETESYLELLPVYSTILVEEGDTTYYYNFDGWFADSDKTIAADGIMPSSNLTVYAKLSFIRQYTVKLLTIFDNNQKVYEERVEVGSTITLPNTIKVDTNTQWYTTSGYTTQVSLPTVMPNQNTTLHIRNRYTVTYTYYTISNHATLNSATSSESLYQGEAFHCPSQTNDYIDYKNSSNVLDYRLYYTFNGYTNSQENCSTMPNHDYSLTSAYSTVRKNYYTISFDMTLDYIPKSCAAGAHYKSTPSTPESLRLLEGSVINLKDSKYQISATIWATALSFGVKYNYKSTTWGTSKHADYSDGGNGVTSWTVSGDATLKPYWKKQ